MNTHSVTDTSQIHEWVAAACRDRTSPLGHCARQWEFEHPAVDLPALMQGVSNGWYFCDSSGHEQCGLGIAKRWRWTSAHGLADMDQERLLLQSEGLSPDTVIGGGFSFGAPSERDRTWDAFGYTQWMLPAIFIDQDNGRARVRVTVYAKGGQSQDLLPDYYAKLWALIEHPAAQNDKAARVLSQHMAPPSEKWMDLVADAVADIRRGALDKVVVARRVDTKFSEVPAVGRILHSLRKNNPQTTVFAIRAGGDTFLGATPECLLAVRNGALDTMALAGTAARKTSRAADDQSAQALLSSPKDLREHRAVVRRITDTLSPYADLSMPAGPEILTLSNVHHLRTPIHGRMRQETSLWTLAMALHPTPAVGGEPPAAAKGWLDLHEGLNRGWYAGSVGLTNLAGSGNLWVALRSALIRGDTAYCYAGCGIMADSDPRRELEESEWKLQAMLAALGVNP